MSIKSWSAKRDSNEPLIQRALGAAGADFIRLDPFDLLVLFRGRVFLLEVKTRKGRLTQNQELLLQRGWPVIIVRTAEDALAAIGAVPQVQTGE